MNLENIFGNLVSGSGKGITFTHEDRDDEFCSYDELKEHCAKLAAYLKKKGVKRGDEVLVHSADLKYFITSMWACFYGGYIAVPIDNGSNDTKAQTIKYILDSMKDPYVICDSISKEYYSGEFADRTFDITNIDLDDDIVYEPPVSMNTEDIAYVQYSSGSTGTPKGTALSFGNIITDAKSVARRCKVNKDDVIVVWQPLTHCYGILAFHFTPLIFGCNQVLIPTADYMMDPMLWARKVDKYRGTVSGMIPFAVKKFINYYQQMNGTYSWDLSSLKVVIVGGEQVDKKVCDQFLDILEKYNADRHLLVPGYGLTESTAVTSLHDNTDLIKEYYVRLGTIGIGNKVEPDVDKKDATGFISVGSPLDCMKAKIIDEEYNDLGENTIGRLVISGDNISPGSYFKGNVTPLKDLKNGWLDTGDLAFLSDGKIMIVGRSKEMLVVNGMKFAVSDIENIVMDTIQGVYTKTSACNGFSRIRESEQVYIFVETNISFKNAYERKVFLKYRDLIRKNVFEKTGLLIENVFPIAEIPTTGSGKIKRIELSNQVNQGLWEECAKQIEKAIHSEENTGVDKMSIEKVRSIIKEIISGSTKLPVDDIDIQFHDYGIVSAEIPRVVKEINERFGTNIEVSVIFNYPNIRKLADFVHDNMNTKKTEQIVTVQVEDIDKSNKLAIVGMSCRYPGGANSIDEFWKVLEEGIDGIIDVPEDRWELERFYDSDKTAPGKMYCPKGGFLHTDVYGFDTKLFNMSPKEALAVAPEHKMLLELTLEAYENGNLNITDYSGTNTGVFIGISTNEYITTQLYSGDYKKIDAYALTGTCFSTCCGRISYTFGFEGPCLAVDTACSSSLTALQVACQSLKDNQTDTAVVGGINLMLTPAPNIGFSKLQATSPEGHCKSFDESADGYGRSEGAGIIIIKRLEDAERDNDKIFGVIRAAAINQDGKSNGLTAPSGAAQEKVIRKAIKEAGIDAGMVSYVETHGTGTKLGDPIEAGALTKTYGEARRNKSPLMIGSAKSNIGHTEAGSGMAAMIKVLMSMDHDEIPGNLNFNTPNTFIDWKNNNLSVVAKNTEWKSDGGHRYAGISGFGFGGSNAHIIVEDYFDRTQKVSDAGEKGSDLMLKLSAKSEVSLRQYAEKYVEFLSKCPDEDVPSILKLANTSRVDYESRLVVTGSDKETIIARLKSYINGQASDGVYHNGKDGISYVKDRTPVYMFTGQGSQYVGMGRELYEKSAVFAESMDLCAKLFKPYLLCSITDMLYGENASDEKVNKTCYSQPLIFAFEYSLSKYLEACGIKPAAVMGHSIGEYAAAVVSGVMSLEDAVMAVAIRGRLMDSAPGHGSMGTLFASEETVNELIAPYADKVSIATRNAEANFVISGEAEAVEAILQEAESKKIETRRLVVSHGFHSQLMSPILGEFEDIISSVKINEPEITFVSALYGRPVTSAEELSHDYWVRHIREKVDFYSAVKSVEDNKNYIFTEVGSHTVLSSLCKMILSEKSEICPALRRKFHDNAQIAAMLGILYVSGINIDWNKISFDGIKNIPNHTFLPTYPYDKQHICAELPLEFDNTAKTDINGDPLLGQHIESPILQGANIYQRLFDEHEPKFMPEHVIFEKPISPAAGHMSMLISMMKKNNKNAKRCILSAAEFRAPLAIDTDETRVVQFCQAAPDASGISDVSIVSHSENSEWLTHMVGKAEVSDEYAVSEEAFDVSAAEKLKFGYKADDTVYRMMRETGFKLGETFRRIDRYSLNENVAISFLKAPENLPDADIYTIYPGMLDSILQTEFCVIFEEFVKNSSDNSKRTVIPYYIESVEFNYRQFNNLWCRTTSKMKDDVINGSIEAFNESGELVMRIKGFMGKITDRSTLLREMSGNKDKMFYQVNWENVKPEESSNNASTVCVLASNDEDAKRFADKFAENGAKTAYAVYNSDGNVDACIEAFRTLLSGATDDKCKIMFICGADKADDTCLYVRNAFEVVKAIQADDELSGKAELHFLTLNANSVEENEGADPADSLVWGFVKSARIEHAEMFGGIVDTDEKNFNELSDILINALTDKGDEEISIRNDKMYISRLAKAEKTSKLTSEPIQFSDDASYIITGGTGMLGQVYTEQLLGHGAKNIVLVCRKQPSDKVMENLNRMKAEYDADITIEYCDLNELSNAEELIARLASNGKTVKGIVHCAGVLRDTPISSMTWENFQFVLEPKTKGIRNIVNAAGKDKLDFVIMLSSVASVFGNYGQSNYSAANNFLNGYAAQLNAEGVNAYPVCWGPWQGGGMASGNQSIDENLSRMGIESFAPELGGEIIGSLLDKPRKHVVAADVNWRQYAESVGKSQSEHFIVELIDKSNADDAVSDTDNDKFIEELKSLSEDERKEVLLEKLQKICSDIMGFQGDQKLDPYSSINEQGADSLMTFTMRSNMNKLLGTNLAVS
ncbi:MAG: SDR family NAD(P)-dependent oxidoreductase, partial [Ruminococcus sp.]|nr:SDR family NAD(P)-dependent oxidoreductase [Ruminococcus sp.]